MLLIKMYNYIENTGNIDVFSILNVLYEKFWKNIA